MLAAMLSRAAKFCLLALLVVSIGGPWPVLQSIAWAGMLIEYSRDGSVVEAVSKTFDGKHPCNLCKSIAAGKKTEQKKAPCQKSKKLEFPPVREDVVLTTTLRFELSPRIDLAGNLAFERPPTPP